VPSVDRGHDRPTVAFCDMRCGEARERGQADGGLSGRERNPARGRDADPQAREAAGSDRDGDAAERTELDRGLVHHPRDQRHHGFGMAARHDAALARHDRSRGAVENRGRAGIERTVNGKDKHGSDVRCQTSPFTHLI